MLYIFFNMPSPRKEEIAKYGGGERGCRSLPESDIIVTFISLSSVRLYVFFIKTLFSLISSYGEFGSVLMFIFTQINLYFFLLI